MQSRVQDIPSSKPLVISIRIVLIKELTKVLEEKNNQINISYLYVFQINHFPLALFWRNNDVL